MIKTFFISSFFYMIFTEKNPVYTYIPSMRIFYTDYSSKMAVSDVLSAKTVFPDLKPIKGFATCLAVKTLGERG